MLATVAIAAIVLVTKSVSSEENNPDAIIHNDQILSLLSLCLQLPRRKKIWIKLRMTILQIRKSRSQKESDDSKEEALYDEKENHQQESSVNISLSGKILIKNNEGKVIEPQNVNLQDMSVSLCKEDGAEIGRSKMKEDGTYIFTEVSIIPNNSHYVKIDLKNNEGYAFAKENSNGIVGVTLNEEKKQVVKNIYLENLGQPSATILLYNSFGERSNVNLQKATILVTGVSNMDVKWKIIEEETLEVVKQGEGNTLTSEDFTIERGTQ